MIDGEPLQPNDELLASQREQAADVVEAFYSRYGHIPGAIGRFGLALMIEDGNNALAEYAESIREVVASGGETVARIVDLGLSTSYVYHHQLAHIRWGEVPIIDDTAIEQLDREDNTNRGLGRFMRGYRDGLLEEWVVKQSVESFDELGESLGGLVSHFAHEEGFRDKRGFFIAVIYGASQVNKAFTIQETIPQD